MSDRPAAEFRVERYKFLLQQLNATNENVHRFLAMYQTLATTLVGAGLALFVGYRKWEIAFSVARAGVVGVGWLITLVGLFTVLMVISNVASWMDYRREECDLSNEVVGKGFREPPRISNFYRWHETYIVLFIGLSTALIWLLINAYVIPNMR